MIRMLLRLLLLLVIVRLAQDINRDLQTHPNLLLLPWDPSNPRRLQHLAPHLPAHLDPTQWLWLGMQ